MKCGLKSKYIQSTELWSSSSSDHFSITSISCVADDLSFLNPIWCAIHDFISNNCFQLYKWLLWGWLADNLKLHVSTLCMDKGFAIRLTVTIISFGWMASEPCGFDSYIIFKCLFTVSSLNSIFSSSLGTVFLWVSSWPGHIFKRHLGRLLSFALYFFLYNVWPFLTIFLDVACASLYSLLFC